MSVRLPSARTVAIALASLAAAYLLFAWLALPRIIQSQAEDFIADKTGHRLTLDRPEFNPFQLSLRIANLRLAAGDGKPLLAFKELLVDLSAASIARRAWVFDSIRLDAPDAVVVLQPDGRLNWSPLIDALKGKDGKSDSPVPRLEIRHFILAGGSMAFDDQRVAFATRLQPLDLELSDISTLADDQGRYQLSARTASGASLRWQGEATLNPVVVTGSLGVDKLDLAGLAPYFKDASALAPPSGSAALSSRYRLTYAGGRLDLILDKLTAKLAGVRVRTIKPVAADLAVDVIEARDGHFDLARKVLTLGALNFAGSRLDLPRPAGGPLKPLQLGSLAVEDVQLDLDGRSLAVGRIALQAGRFTAARDAQGRIDVLAAWQSLPRPAEVIKPAATSADREWHYRVNKVELSDSSAAFRDETMTPAADILLQEITVVAEGISENLRAPLPLRASFRARDGGDFEATGQIVPALPSADFKLKVRDLSLKPAQPYLGARTGLTLANGLFTAEGRATYTQRASSFKGSASVRDMLFNETATGDRFLAWKSLVSSDLTLSPAKLDIAQLKLEGLNAKLIIHKDKSVNIGSILRKKSGPGATAVPIPAAGVPADNVAAPFLVNVDALQIGKSEMDFADLSLALPFGTHIQRMHGAIIGLSSRPGAPGQIELEGQVDDYGLARVVGQIDLFHPAEFTDLKVVFSNVEMNRLTPYSATFAGRKIDSGKLSLDLEYKIEKRQLAGESKIIMDQLTLGERVASPEARDLPLDLAIALLQDSDGRIDLGLPVSGSLDDPQFSYGGLVWKAIANVISKIVTAPFRALGALFGGGGEDLKSIAYESGDAHLTPPEREKLVRLAGALNKRPGLSLTLHGAYADTDRLSLQERQLRRAVAERAGQHLDGGTRPGPLSTRAPKVQEALESLYAERVGADQLAALKRAFRQANPGQLEQGVAGKMMSRLSGLMRQESVPSGKEIADLKGEDFHAILFERLRDLETVGETALLALANARAQHAAAGLKAAGAPVDRVMLGASEKVNGTASGVPLTLVLGAAAKPAAPAATSR